MFGNVLLLGTTSYIKKGKWFDSTNLINSAILLDTSNELSQAVIHSVCI